MSIAELPAETVLDLDIAVTELDRDSSGLMLTKEEFRAIDECERGYPYELIGGMVVVSPPASAEERGPNARFDHWLWSYHENHPDTSTLDDTLPEQEIETVNNIRRADRAIWVGLGRTPDPDKDVPTIAIEFVSKSRRDRRRDYDQKRVEYAAVGVKEYWIIDRYRRTMTVCEGEQKKRVVKESEILETPRLRGFKLPLGELLAIADRWAKKSD